MKAKMRVPFIVVIGLALVIVMTSGVEAAGECTMSVVLPAELQIAGATVDVRYTLSGLTHGDAFEVTDGSAFQWRLNVSGFRGPWRAGTGVCGGQLVVGAADYALMTMGMPDGLVASGARVNIRYDSPDRLFGRGEGLYLPSGITVQWQLKVSGFTGNYQSKLVDGSQLQVTDDHYCLMEIQMPAGLSSAGGGVNIRYDSPDRIYGSGEKIHLPKGITIQWQLKVSGFSGAYESNLVDCSPLAVNEAHYCLMAVSIPADLASAGAKVNIRYDSPDRLFNNGDTIYLPKGITIQWQLKASGCNGAYQTKVVDCSPLLAEDPDVQACLLSGQVGSITVRKQTLPAGAAGQFSFTGVAAGTIGHGGQLVASDLQPGNYAVTESDPGTGFLLTNIVCDDGNSSGNVTTRTATFQVEAGENITCTFTNSRKSLIVSKQLQEPVSGQAIVGQTVRYGITVTNNGAVDLGAVTLRETYDSNCLQSLRAEVAPDVHGGSAGYLQWNMGGLNAGASHTLWVEFEALDACSPTINYAIAQSDGLTAEGQATLDISGPQAFVAGYVFHDVNKNGQHDLACGDTDTQPAGCEPGLEGARAAMRDLERFTSTAGWYSFNALQPGVFTVTAGAPEGTWWTPTTAESCQVTLDNGWEQGWCSFGYTWGQPGIPTQSTAPRNQEMTIRPLQDATISEWDSDRDGDAIHLTVRQPGVSSTLLQFDLSSLPQNAQVGWAKLRLYAPALSNESNVLYLTAYPLNRRWLEHEATWNEAQDGMSWTSAGAVGDYGAAAGWSWTDSPGWVEIDLDPAALSEHGFIVRGEGSWDREVAGQFFSREYAEAAVRPQLVVGYDLP